MAREADLRPAAERPLAALLGRPISWHEAADAVITAAHTVFDSVRSDDLAHQIAPLAAPWEAQFRDPRWTWER
jgi:hypothetical protein